jgi:hypothetical protein
VHSLSSVHPFSVTSNGLYRDQNGRLSALLDSVGAHAVLVRPDFYAFGLVSDPTEVRGLIEALACALR